MNKLALVLFMFVFAAFCSCSSDTEETVIYRIFITETSSGYMGSRADEAYNVYNSISEGIQEFETKYCGEWTDIAKDKDYAAGDKAANSKFETVVGNFKNFEISVNDKIANLSTTTSNQFKFAGKLVVTRISMEQENEKTLNSYSFSFAFPE